MDNIAVIKKVKFINNELNKVTETIIEANNGVQKNMYVIARSLAYAYSRNLFEDDGFKNVSEYANMVFGYKKSRTYTLVKIGLDFVNENNESTLPHESGRDFTITQIEKMLPMAKKKNELVAMIEDGVIYPGMSCKEIEGIVKSVNGKDKIDKVNKDEDIEDSQECEIEEDKEYYVTTKKDGNFTDLGIMYKSYFLDYLDSIDYDYRYIVEVEDGIKVFCEYGMDIFVIIAKNKVEE